MIPIWKRQAAAWSRGPGICRRSGSDLRSAPRKPRSRGVHTDCWEHVRKKYKMKKYMDLDDPKTMFNYELFYQIWCFTTKIKFLTNLVVRVPTSVHIIGLEVGPYWSLWPGVSNSGSKLHANFAGKHNMSMYSTQTSRVFHANSFQPVLCETCIYRCIYINTCTCRC